MAAQLYQASARYQPKDPHLRYLWAHALASSGDDQGAIEQARQSLAIDPKQTETAALLGILLRRQGDNAEAIRLLEQAWNANPRSWDAGRELAEWYLARGESDRAASILGVVREHSPKDRRAEELFARAAEESGRLPEALAAWQRVHAVGQGDPREWDAVSHIARLRPLVQEESSPNAIGNQAEPFHYTSSREPAPSSGPPRSARWEYPPLPSSPKR
jgi:tetratricopeptide (TPR) repeat protein